MTTKVIKAMTNKEKNARFAKLTKAQKRVLIAKDVIAALRAKSIIAKTGVWADRADNLPLYHLSYDGDKSLDQSNEQLSTLIGKDIPCNVCGVGALFVCGVRRFNNLKAGKVPGIIYSLNTLRPFLKRYFTVVQLGLIEAAFEMRNMRSILSGDRAAEMFYRQEPDGRMISIMKNIIKNNGTFVVKSV